MAGREAGVSEGLERIPLRRLDMQRGRLRARTRGGVDVGLDLPRGTVLRHGDVVEGDGRTMVIEQVPELVCVVRHGPDVPAHMLVLVGHAIGNMHRPVSVRGGSLTFPLQDESETETFRRVLEGIGPGRFDVASEEAVFVPHAAADVVGHA